MDTEELQTLRERVKAEIIALSEEEILAVGDLLRLELFDSLHCVDNVE